jgi:hypothetical protein
VARLLAACHRHCGTTSGSWPGLPVFLIIKPGGEKQHDGSEACHGKPAEIGSREGQSL